MIANSLPMHPGQVLSEVYMSEMGLNQTALANLCGCSPRKINEIVNKKHSITAETAPALAGVLKTSPEFWLNLQSNYELWQAKAIN